MTKLPPSLPSGSSLSQTQSHLEDNSHSTQQPPVKHRRSKDQQQHVHAHSHSHLRHSHSSPGLRPIGDSHTHSSSNLDSAEITVAQDKNKKEDDTNDLALRRLNEHDTNHFLDLDHSHSFSHNRRQAVDEASDVYVTRVVQTVSVVQVVNSLGSPLETKTLYANPNTIVVDTLSGNTVDISVLVDTAPTDAPPASDPEASDHVPVSSMVPVITDDLLPSSVPSTASTPPVSHATPFTPSSNSLSGTAPLSSQSTGSASAPLSAGPMTTNGSLNATTFETPSNVNSTILYSSSTTNQTGSPMLANYTQTPASSEHTYSHTYVNWSGTSTYDSEHSTATSTTYSNGQFGDFTINHIEPTSNVDTSDESDDSSGDGGGVVEPLSTEEKRIVGGVVGGVAGAAFLLILIVWLLKAKRRRGVQDITGEAGAISRGLTGGPPSGGGNGGSAMAERSAPFSVTAALAGLAGKKNSSPASQSEQGGERGFYRVSGRKLPPVLMAGGDGYTDPRESVASGTSDYHRGSQAFERDTEGQYHLALGSPMRPVSGVPIMRSGPVRSPVTITDPNPFADPPSPPRAPAAPHDSLGRSLTSQDGSRGSSSRFQEVI